MYIKNFQDGCQDDWPRWQVEPANAAENCPKDMVLVSGTDFAWSKNKYMTVYMTFDRNTEF